MSCTLWGALGLLFHKALAHLLSFGGSLLQEFRKGFWYSFYSCNCCCCPRTPNICDWSSQLWFLEDIPSNKCEEFQKVSSLIPDFQLESKDLLFSCVLRHSIHIEIFEHISYLKPAKKRRFNFQYPFVSDPNILLLYHFSCSWGTKSLQNSQTVLVAAAR